jgi:hypothetical protein
MNTCLGGDVFVTIHVSYWNFRISVFSVVTLSVTDELLVLKETFYHWSRGVFTMKQVPQKCYYTSAKTYEITFQKI